MQCTADTNCDKSIGTGSKHGALVGTGTMLKRTSKHSEKQ